MSEMQKKKKKWGVTDFVLEITCREEHPKSEKSGFLPNKATVAVSPKILQLHLWSEIFSAKYSLNGTIKRI